MIDFSRRGHGYNNKRGSAWGSTIAVVIIVVLSLVAVMGFAKTFSKKSPSVSWDGVSSFVTGFSTNPNMVFIFQKDPKRVVLLELGNYRAKASVNSQNLVKNLSITLGSPVTNYVDANASSFDDAKKSFENFTSYLTPLKILTVGWGGDSMGTNISRMDALKLWWQLKGIRPNEIKTVSLNPKMDDRESKVLGETSDFLNQQVLPYFENIKILAEGIPVNIVDKSGGNGALGLAADFVSAVGGSVGDVSVGKDKTADCHILTNRKSSYTAKYLAKLFSCDIKDTALDEESPTMTLEIGTNFLEKYFR